MMNSNLKSIDLNNGSLKNRYLDFCDAQMKQRMVWFLIPLMSLGGAIMPIGIFAMSYFNGYISFVGISVLLFFGNIILSIAEQHTRILISFYLFTVLVHILIPFFSLIISLI